MSSDIPNRQTDAVIFQDSHPFTHIERDPWGASIEVTTWPVVRISVQEVERLIIAAYGKDREGESVGKVPHEISFQDPANGTMHRFWSNDPMWGRHRTTWAIQESAHAQGAKVVDQLSNPNDDQGWTHIQHRPDGSLVGVQLFDWNGVDETFKVGKPFAPGSGPVSDLRVSYYEGENRGMYARDPKDTNFLSVV